MTPAALAAMKSLAEGATPGPYRWQTTGFASQAGEPAPSLLGDRGHGVLSCDGPANGPSEADARYIAAVSPEVVLALLDRLERVEAQEAVRGGEWCAQNRAEGRGPCGACAWCCKQASDDAERLRLAVAAYLKARDTWGYTMGAINAEARAADALRAALRGEP